MNWFKRIFGGRTTEAASSQISILEAEALLSRTALDARSLGLEWEVFRVSDTNSMLPTYDTNALLVGETCPYSALREGDIVLYRANPDKWGTNGGMVVCHRLNNLEKGGWRALGDANGTQDPELVTPGNFYKRVAAVVYCKV